MHLNTTSGGPMPMRVAIAEGRSSTVGSIAAAPSFSASTAVSIRFTDDYRCGAGIDRHQSDAESGSGRHQ